MGTNPELTRRDFLVLAGASVGGVALAACGDDDEGVPTEQPPALELLITEMPVLLYGKRRVLDKASVAFAQSDEWYSFELAGAKPEHAYAVAVRRTKSFTDVRVNISLADKLWKSVEAKYTTLQPLNRLWISRGYLHGEERTNSCFPQPPELRPFRGQTWFATYTHDDRSLLQQSERSYRFDKPRGAVELALHDGYGYTREWVTHEDGVGHDYTSRFFRNSDLMTEIREIVMGLGVMRDRACTALPTASYCDTDDI